MAEKFFKRIAHGEPNVQGFFSYEETFYIRRIKSSSLARELNIHAFGDCLWRRGCEFVDKRSVSISIELILDGQMRFIEDDISQNVGPGQVIFLKPLREQSMKAKSPTVNKMCVILEGTLAEKLMSSGNFANLSVMNLSDLGQVSAVFARIRRAVKTQSDDRTLSMLAFELMLILDSQCAKTDYPQALQKALELLDRSVNYNIALNELAHRSGASVSNLSRMFRKHLGCSPVEYQITQRMDLARRLLEFGNMSVREVAERCGYHSASFFSRAFKQRFGCSPVRRRQ